MVSQFTITCIDFMQFEFLQATSQMILKKKESYLCASRKTYTAKEGGGLTGPLFMQPDYLC